ncbi:MAG: cytochrome c peroxidase [Chitinophagales bacterium]
MKKHLYLLWLVIFASIFMSSQMNNKTLIMNEDEYVLVLPDEPYDYNDITIPEHYSFFMIFNNEQFVNGGIDNNVATLGRVIFYDRALSYNRTIACGSCHQQQFGFADDVQFSEGFDGQIGTRNALHIADFGLDGYGRFLWDDREDDLSHMTLLPLQNGIEMGITLDELTDRMTDTDYYAGLFQAAFGDENITDERIGIALSQFLMSIMAVNTKLDQGIQNDFADFTAQELEGKTIFENACQNCHNSPFTNVNSDPIIAFFDFMGPHNTGLDIQYADDGLGEATGLNTDNGKFKTVNLKNIALTGPYMHDGRFETLEEVVDFYSDDVQPHPNSTFETHWFFQDNFPVPFEGFNFTEVEKMALVAFLQTFTDETLVNEPRWSDPFVLVNNNVGIENGIEAANIEVYPNPMSTHTLIDLGSFPQNEATQIRLLQLNGQVVRTTKTMNRTYNLLRDNLVAGTYLLEITKDGQQIVEQIVVQ